MTVLEGIAFATITWAAGLLLGRWALTSTLICVLGRLVFSAMGGATGTIAILFLMGTLGQNPGTGTAVAVSATLAGYLVAFGAMLYGSVPKLTDAVITNAYDSLRRRNRRENSHSS